MFCQRSSSLSTHHTAAKRLYRYQPTEEKVNRIFRQNLVRSNIIGAYAQHDNAAFLHLMVGIAERARFGSASRCIIFAALDACEIYVFPRTQ
jgi:hypothetical protein